MTTPPDPIVRCAPVHADDDAFLHQLYASARADEIAAWGWSSTERDAFIRMQYDMQRRALALQYPSAEESIVWRDRDRIGRLVVDRGHALRLIDIALLPQWRGRGIGTGLLRMLQSEATVRGCALRLSVVTGNPALRLYRRLGFEDTGDGTDDVRRSLVWRPTAACPSAPVI